MEKTYLKNDMVKLYSPNGVKDTRNGAVYSEAVVEAKDVRYFVEA